jgi:predicted methyltransferase
LSSRLRTIGKRKESYLRSLNPFAYGIIDIQSIDYSQESIDFFKGHCRDVILDLDRRIEDVIVHDVFQDHRSHRIVINITLFLKSTKETFTTDFKIS